VLDNAIATSMDGRAAWRDNVFVERPWKSVKYEEACLRAHDGVAEARVSISGSTFHPIAAIQRASRHVGEVPHADIGECRH
jgi:hypothetical protein